MAILVGPEIVIATTRHRTGLEPMVGKLGLLEGKGVPLFNGGDHRPTLPDLWFTGMRPNVRGCFANARIQARAIAKAIVTSPRRAARQQRQETPPQPTTASAKRPEARTLSQPEQNPLA